MTMRLRGSRATTFVALASSAALAAAAAVTAPGCAGARHPTAVASAVSPTPLPSPVALPPMHERTLANGLDVLVVEDHELPMVTLMLQFSSGQEAEPADKAGIADLAMQLLREGTKTHTADAIAEQIDFVGGDLSASTGADWMEVDGRVLSRDVDTLLALVADTVISPVFPPEEVENARRQAIADVKSRYDDPEAVGWNHAAALLYGESDPYAAERTERSLKAIHRDDLREFHDRWIVPGNAILGIVGDVDASVIDEVDRAFAAWPAATPPSRAIAVRTRGKAVRIVDKPDLTQSFITLALPGMPRRSPDWITARVLDAVVGDGFSTRLTRLVRTEKGKTYDISGRFDFNRRRGMYLVQTSTRTSETGATLALVRDALAGLASGKKPVTAGELAQAKRNLIGAYPRKFETAESVGSMILTARLFGVPLEQVTDYRRMVAGVGLDQVNELARRMLDPTNAVVVVVGNADGMKKDVEAVVGPAEVVPLLTPTHQIDRAAAAAAAPQGAGTGRKE